MAEGMKCDVFRHCDNLWRTPQLESSTTSKHNSGPTRRPCPCSKYLFLVSDQIPLCVPGTDFNFDFLSYSPNATLILDSVVYRRDACLPTPLHNQILQGIARPYGCLPGNQGVGQMSWCDPVTSQCWFNTTYLYNFCAMASIPSSPELDDEGGYVGERI